MNITSIGNRPLALAGHLRHAVYLIQTGAIHYNWRDNCSCNCGALVRSISGLSKPEMNKRILADTATYQKTMNANHPRHSGSWAVMAEYVCPLNPEMKAPEFFQSLLDAGLLADDFAHLETLSHPAIIAENKGFFKSGKFTYDKEKDVISYMNLWAQKIEDWHKNNPTASATPAPVHPVVKHYPSETEMERIESRPLVSK